MRRRRSAQEQADEREYQLAKRMHRRAMREHADAWARLQEAQSALDLAGYLLRAAWNKARGTRVT